VKFTAVDGEVEAIGGSHCVEEMDSEVDVLLQLGRSKCDCDCGEHGVLQCPAMFLAETSSRGDIESIEGSHGVDVMDTEVDVLLQLGQSKCDCDCGEHNAL
jgi:hypothetical protein